MISRRYFLKSGSLAMMSAGLAPAFLGRIAAARAGARGKILVAIFQRGAADGLNIVVRHGERTYYDLRPTIAIPPPHSGEERKALDLDGFFGLHPALEPIFGLYKAGSLAVVQAAGSPDNTRSHFDAQDYMETATPGLKSTRDGWLNRYLLAAADPQATPFRAVSLTRSLPRTLKGRAPALAMGSLAGFGFRAGPISDQVQEGFEAMYASASPGSLREAGKETFEAIDFLRKANPGQQQPPEGVRYPGSPFGNSLRQIAQLIKAGVGLEVAFAETGGWDHHVNEGGVQGQLALKVADLAQSISAFCLDVGERMADVVLLTMSEFGRTVRENGNRGTDHGHANVMFVAGGPVRGGKVYGRWPGLAPDRLHERRDLALTTDFRDVFGEVLVRHLRLERTAGIFPGHSLRVENFRGFLA